MNATYRSCIERVETNEHRAPPWSHTEFSPVFVIGHGSSGTSLMVELLRRHLKIAFGTESQFIIRIARRLGSYGDLHDSDNSRRLVSHLLQERWFERCKRFEYFPDVESILSRVEEPSYAGILRAIFEGLADQMQMVRWGDKTPNYLNDLDTLDELFPDAKYIHVIRDGRDVALSLKSRCFGANNAFRAAHCWRSAIDKADEFSLRLRPEQIVNVRYEQLLGSPVESFAMLARFLKISDPDGCLLDEIKRAIPDSIKSGNCDKWIKSMSARETRTFDQIACQQLLRHGYDSSAKEPRSASRIEHGYWMVDDRIRRYGNSEYWKDNLYKARLRVRGVCRHLLKF